MQHSPQEIKEKLLKALDKEYNVLDMPVVVEIVGILEKIPITKEALETTRLGKYINELRRKTTNENLAKRAKDLVRKWRHLILPQNSAETASQNGGTTRQSTVGSQQQIRGISPGVNRLSAAAAGPPAWKRKDQLSPALVKSTPPSPSSRLSSLSPGVKLPMSRSTSTSPALVKLDGESTTTAAAATLLRSSNRTRPPPPPSAAADKLIKQQPVNVAPPQVETTPPRPRGRPPLDPEVKAARARPPGSSPPPSGRGRGRPPKNKKKIKEVEDELVPKNSPANKRLRKELSVEELGVGVGVDNDNIAAKRQRVNGAYDTPRVPPVHAATNQVPLLLPNHCAANPETDLSPKKRGRKKGSKNAPKSYRVDRPDSDDDVKRKMASVGRNPKVKTTKELLASIQKESSIECLRTKTLSDLGVNDLGGGGAGVDDDVDIDVEVVDDVELHQVKREHIHKYLESQQTCIADVPLSRPESRSSPHSIIDVVTPSPSPLRCSEPKVEEETIDQLLAKLPRVNYMESFEDEDETYGQSPVEREITEEDVVRLHTERLDGLNGNWNDGLAVSGGRYGAASLLPNCEEVEEEEVGEKRENLDNFREWHETVSKTSYKGDLLHILPYVIID